MSSEVNMFMARYDARNLSRDAKYMIFYSDECLRQPDTLKALELAADRLNALLYRLKRNEDGD